MKFLVIITARKGSKRLKNKNLIILNKKPLIYWTIKYAKKIKEIKKIIVSTDSNKILKKSNQFGLTTKWLRPKNLANDDTLSEEVVKHAYKKEKNNGFNADAIILLQPTSPFRTLKSIQKAISIFKKEPNIPLISVFKLKHPKKILAMSNNKLSLIGIKKELFMPNGSILIINTKQAMKTKNYLSKKLNFVILPGVKENIDIDDIQDLNLSKILSKTKFKNI